MTPELYSVLLAISLILLFCSIAMSVYLFYDVVSGNYRRLIPNRDQSEQPAEQGDNPAGISHSKPLQ